jgi:hypothetical protein
VPVTWIGHFATSVDVAIGTIGASTSHPALSGQATVSQSFAAQE